MSCPNCENSLFEAAIFNPKFLHKQIARFAVKELDGQDFPVTLMCSGALMVAISAAYLVSKTKIDIQFQNLPAIGIGLGAGCFLFGLMYLRFIALEKSDGINKQNHLGHIHF